MQFVLVASKAKSNAVRSPRSAKYSHKFTRTPYPVPESHYPLNLIRQYSEKHYTTQICLYPTFDTRCDGILLHCIVLLAGIQQLLVELFFYLQSTVQLSYSILIFIAMNRGDWSTTRKEISGMLVLGGIVHTITFPL